VSDEVIAVTDSRKLGRRSMCTIAPLELLDKVVTDGKATQAMRKILRQAEVEVVIA